MRDLEPFDIMRYYVTYRDTEKAVIDNIDEKSQAQRLIAYNKYVNQHMKIARIFKKNTVDMVLITTKNFFRSGETDLATLSNNYYKGELLSGNRKNALVAASKLLWLYNHNVIIMDENNRKQLKAKNYVDFVEKWEALYKVKEPEIIRIIEHYFQNIDPIMGNKWFRMRVFDQFLWSL